MDCNAKKNKNVSACFIPDERDRILKQCLEQNSITHAYFDLITSSLTMERAGDNIRVEFREITREDIPNNWPKSTYLWDICIPLKEEVDIITDTFVSIRGKK